MSTTARTPTTSLSSARPALTGVSYVLSNPVLGAVGVFAALAAWQFLSMARVLDRATFPSAWETLRELGNQALDGALWQEIWATLSTALAGLVLVLLIGTVLALLIGMIKAVEQSTWFLVEFLKPIPPIALIPLGLLLWGPHPTMKITLITFGALWPFLTQMIYGIRQTNSVALDMAASYRLGWRLTVMRIVIPTLLPYALTGLRISASIAVIVSVVTELVGGADGIGQAISVAQVNNLIPTMYAYILTAGLLGVLINLIFTALEKPLLFWHPSQRKEK